jgi:hypothetical protein
MASRLYGRKQKPKARPLRLALNALRNCKVLCRMLASVDWSPVYSHEPGPAAMHGEIPPFPR